MTEYTKTNPETEIAELLRLHKGKGFIAEFTPDGKLISVQTDNAQIKTWLLLKNMTTKT